MHHYPSPDFASATLCACITSNGTRPDGNGKYETGSGSNIRNRGRFIQMASLIIPS